MTSGERPIGAAKGKQSNTEALCHPPPPAPPQLAVLNQYCTILSVMHLFLQYKVSSLHIPSPMWSSLRLSWRSAEFPPYPPPPPPTLNTCTSIFPVGGLT